MTNASLSDKGFNFVDQLFDRDRKLKTCECLNDELSLANSKKFKLFQIIHAFRSSGGKSFVATYDNLSNVFLQDHNLILKNHVYALSKLGSEELCNTGNKEFIVFCVCIMAL